MPLATGTALAALGAKAAGAAVNPTVFLSTGAGPLGKAASAVFHPSVFLSTGAAPLGKGLGASLMSIKAGKAAAASAPAVASFLSHGGDTAADLVTSGGASFLASKAAAASAAGGKAAGGIFLGKGAGAGTVGTSFAKVGSGIGTAKPSFLKVAQKTCFAKTKKSVANVVRPSVANATSSAATGAAAAAADHASDIVTQAPHTWVAPPPSGAEAVDPGAAGFGPDDAADAGLVDDAGPSSRRSMLGGFVRGALGMEQDDDVLGELSHQAGSRMLGHLFGGDGNNTASALMGGLGGLGLAGGALPGAEQALDPGMVDAKEVEEETMAVVALLPSLFKKLSFSRSWKGGDNGEGRGRSIHLTGKTYRRRPSAASTDCSSDSGCPSDSSLSSGPPSARRVIRSDASERKVTYANFL